MTFTLAKHWSSSLDKQLEAFRASIRHFYGCEETAYSLLYYSKKKQRYPRRIEAMAFLAYIQVATFP